MNATSNQKRAIHAILYSRGMLKSKGYIIEGITNGRSESIKELTFDEAKMLLEQLNDDARTRNISSPMMSKLFAMAFEMGMVRVETVVDGSGNIKKKKNYEHVHAWVEKYGYLKKPLRQYLYNELPKLVTQFQIGPYNDYINKSKKSAE